MVSLLAELCQVPFQGTGVFVGSSEWSAENKVLYPVLCLSGAETQAVSPGLSQVPCLDWILPHSSCLGLLEAIPRGPVRQPCQSLGATGVGCSRYSMGVGGAGL